MNDTIDEISLKTETSIISQKILDNLKEWQDIDLIEELEKDLLIVDYINIIPSDVVITEEKRDRINKMMREFLNRIKHEKDTQK